MGAGGKSQLEIAELAAAAQASRSSSGKSSGIMKVLEKFWSTHEKHFTYEDLLEKYIVYVGVRSAESSRTLPDVEIYGSGATSEIAGDQNKTLLENERLKTQLISEQRAVLLARQQNVQLTSQNDSLLEGICELAKANKALQAALIAQSEGRICLREAHTGTVSAVLGEQVEVTYETPDGPLKQVYDREQFVHGKLPEEGDLVEAYVIIAVVKGSEAQKESQETSDLPSFRDKGVSGTIRI